MKILNIIYLVSFIIMLSHKSTQDFQLTESKNCLFCGYKYDNIVNIEELKIKAKVCNLCELIVNFTYQNLNKLVLVESHLTQLEIIKKTHEYFITNDIIILPKILDSKATRVYTSPILYADPKFFFTNCVDKLLRIVDYFDDDQPEINYYDLRYVDF